MSAKIDKEFPSDEDAYSSDYESIITSEEEDENSSEPDLRSHEVQDGKSRPTTSTSRPKTRSKSSRPRTRAKSRTKSSVIQRESKKTSKPDLGKEKSLRVCIS